MGNEHIPIGLDVTKTGRVLARALDEALTAAGGSLPTWQVLTTLSQGDLGMQREIASVIGIEGATLTHHLNRMETDGLITRERDPENRRQHRVLLTDAGRGLFGALLEQVVAFDARLRRGLSDDEVSSMRDLLARLRDSASNKEVI
jgi:MarR family transcriptional regulator, transcriptional regulator for hemolysin